MPDEPKRSDIKSLLHQLKTSENPWVVLLREVLWVAGVVGGIALLLFLFSGTWPAAVAIESQSMVPHMNVGDLVIVVEKDRYGAFQTWTDGKESGYMRYGDYGDILIYRPNNAGNVHPIIHRAMTRIEAGDPVPSYINPYRGAVTPAEYLPLTVSNVTSGGYTVLTTGSFNASQAGDLGNNDLLIVSQEGKYVIPSGSFVPDAGYLWESGKTSPSSGYITKGDNNIVSDQSASYSGIGMIEPVRDEWVVGKAIFAVPLIGYLPLNIVWVAVIVFGLMILHDFYTKRKESGRKGEKGTPLKKKGKNR